MGGGDGRLEASLVYTKAKTTRQKVRTNTQISSDCHRHVRAHTCSLLMYLKISVFI